MQLGWNPDLGGGQGPGQNDTDFIEKTDKALSVLSDDGHSYEISGVFFAQGNRDTALAEGTAAEEYEVNFNRFIGAIRDEFASPNLPFVFGQVGDANLNHEDPNRRQKVRLVRDAQASVAAHDRWASMVTTDDLPKLDRLHFDAAGQIEFGQRLANAYFELFAVPEPSSAVLLAVGWGFVRPRQRRVGQPLLGLILFRRVCTLMCRLLRQ